MPQDLRFALRGLGRSPAFAVVVVLTLALGIGATTAVFSVVNTVFLRALPFPEADRLVRIRNYSLAPDGARNRYGVTPRNYARLSDATQALSGTVALLASNATLGGGEAPERVVVVGVSDGWTPVLGVRPIAGRVFSADEERQGRASRVAIIGASLWNRRFGGDPGALGRELLLDQTRYTIVGVMPDRFAFPYDAEVWVPMAIDPDQGTGGSLAVFGRLADGATLGSVRSELETIARRTEADFPRTNRGVGLDAMPIRDSFMQGQDRIVLALLASVGFLLLMACANVANLLLVRGMAREREMAVRAALGASRWRRFRHALAESVVLAAAGGFVGLLLSGWLSGSLAALVPSVLASQIDLAGAPIDARVLAFAVAAAMATAVVFGSAPAWSASSRHAIGALRDGGRSAGSARGRRLLRLFVMGEVALAVVLLAGAAAMVLNFGRLVRADLGFDPDRVATLHVSLEDARYRDGAARAAFVSGALEALRATPGVAAAGLSTVNPLCCGDWGARISVEGVPAPEGAPFITAHQYIAPGYFGAMKIPLLAGRDFTDADREGSQRVVIVDERFARRFWPGEDPIGKHVKRGLPDGPYPWLTVVGVAGRIVASSDYTASWYLPFLQGPLGPSTGEAHFMVRAGTISDALVRSAERAIRSADPGMAVFDVTTMDALLATRLSPDRLGALVGALVGGLGFLLAALGVYGVVSFGVSRRRREIGLRLALGAQRTGIARMVLAQGLRLSFAGIAAGLAGAALLSRLFGSVIFGVQAPTPGVYASVAAALAAAAIAASLIPARRAAAAEPMAALREQ